VPTTLSVEQHLTGLHEAMLAFAQHAAAAGPDVDVPSCPGWTVRRLIGHQGAVHRWAAAAVRGDSLDREPVEKRGRSSDDPVAWLRDGAIDLVRTLVSPPDDVDARVFLLDAPAPRHFWARRQCHETTVHAVDALSAALGRLPRADETWIGRDLALDGLDELLLGFVARTSSQLRCATPTTIAVLPTDADHSYTVTVTDEPPVSVRHEGTASGDVTVEGTAVQLYLALWHRSDELTSDIWPLWHQSAV
jgi:uncharacterized protein (TIGR03083 family)